MSEHSHDKKEARAYLVGLQADLLKDIKEMKEDSLSFSEQIQYFRYLIDSSKTNLDTSFVLDGSYLFTNRTVLVPNVSRFEALKYSGKMNIIENRELLDEILNLYEEQIPYLIKITVSNYADKERMLIPVLDRDLLLSKTGKDNLIKQIQSNDTLSYLFKRIVSQMPFILKQYHKVIYQNIKLVQLIDEEIKK